MIKLPKIKLPKINLPKWIVLPKEIPFIEKWKFGKRYIRVVIPLACLGVVATIAIGASSPLVLQLIQLRQNINNADLKIKDYKHRLGQAKSLNKADMEKEIAFLRKKFSPDYSLSYILNSLTELGNSLNIKVISINPGAEMNHPKIQGLPGYALRVLPIGINLESEYKNFGDFMDSLSRLQDCLILINGYSLSKDENILPRLSIKLELEACILKSAKDIPKQEVAQEEAVSEDVVSQGLIQEEGK